jgi:hypothetical protein
VRFPAQLLPGCERWSGLIDLCLIFPLSKWEMSIANLWYCSHKRRQETVPYWPHGPASEYICINPGVSVTREGSFSRLYRNTGGRQGRCLLVDQTPLPLFSPLFLSFSQQHLKLQPHLLNTRNLASDLQFTRYGQPFLNPLSLRGPLG